MAEVEDVAGAIAGQRRIRCAARRISSRSDKSTAGSRLPCTARRGRPCRQASSSSIRQSMPITCPPASASSGNSAGLPVAKLITGTPGVMPSMIALHVRQHVAAIVVGRQAADPAIEQLHGLCAGGDLGVQIARDRPGQPRHDRVPGPGVAIHQRLGVQIVAAAAPFDRVAGQRERRAGEADHRNRFAASPARVSSTVSITKSSDSTASSSISRSTSPASRTGL